MHNGTDYGIMASYAEGLNIPPAPVLSAALFERFSSRGEADFAGKVLTALRYEFGGRKKKPAGGV